MQLGARPLCLKRCHILETCLQVLSSRLLSLAELEMLPTTVHSMSWFESRSFQLYATFLQELVGDLIYYSQQRSSCFVSQPTCYSARRFLLLEHLHRHHLIHSLFRSDIPQHYPTLLVMLVEHLCYHCARRPWPLAHTSSWQPLQQACQLH